MSTTEPRTSADAVRTELGVSADEYPSVEDDGVTETQQLDRWIARAHILVSERVPSLDGPKAEQVEALVAAHYAHPTITGDASGERVSSVAESEGQISFETGNSGAGPGGHSSPYWAQAVELEPRLEKDDFWFVSA